MGSRDDKNSTITIRSVPTELNQKINSYVFRKYGGFHGNKNKAYLKLLEEAITKEPNNNSLGSTLKISYSANIESSELSYNMVEEDFGILDEVGKDVTENITIEYDNKIKNLHKKQRAIDVMLACLVFVGVTGFILI